MLFSLVYVSRATEPQSQDDLLAILRSARAHNASARITGLLLYRDGTFMQLLEGQQERVESLYASIELDPRHRDVTLVWAEPRPSRQFPGWSMGFRDLDGQAHLEEGYSPVLEDGADPAAAEVELVRELLELFDTHH